jgi:DNA-binding NtrC family response regulator
MERAVILAKGAWIEPSHLPPYLKDSSFPETDAKIVPPKGVTAAEAEKELILRTLRLTNNNKAETARQLGLDVKTIRNKLKAYGIS